MRSPPRTKRKSATKRPSSKSARRAARGSGKKKRTTDGRRRPVALAYLALGSNLGDRRARLEAALRGIAELAPLTKISSLYRTEPIGFARQPDFYNAVVEIAWGGSPAALLAAVRRIERDIGRRPTFTDGPREIDVDILDLGGRVRLRPDPVLPHPRMTQRRFVLAPLAEIRPTWRDPVSGRRAAELLAALPTRPRVTKLARPPGFSAPPPGSRRPRRGVRDSANPR